MNKTLNAIAEQTKSFSGRARRHALLELQTLIHAEVAPEMNKRHIAEWNEMKTSKAGFLPFAPIDYVAADVAIVAEITADYAKPAIVQLGTVPASPELVAA